MFLFVGGGIFFGTALFFFDIISCFPLMCCFFCAVLEWDVGCGMWGVRGGAAAALDVMEALKRTGPEQVVVFVHG